jgi:hypothetical protein
MMFVAPFASPTLTLVLTMFLGLSRRHISAAPSRLSSLIPTSASIIAIMVIPFRVTIFAAVNIVTVFMALMPLARRMMVAIASVFSSHSRHRDGHRKRTSNDITPNPVHDASGFYTARHKPHPVDSK